MPIIPPASMPPPPIRDPRIKYVHMRPDISLEDYQLHQLQDRIGIDEQEAKILLDAYKGYLSSGDIYVLDVLDAQYPRFPEARSILRDSNLNYLTQLHFSQGLDPLFRNYVNHQVISSPSSNPFNNPGFSNIVDPRMTYTSICDTSWDESPRPVNRIPNNINRINKDLFIPIPLPLSGPVRDPIDTRGEGFKPFESEIDHGDSGNNPPDAPSGQPITPRDLTELMKPRPPKKKSAK